MTPHTLPGRRDRTLASQGAWRAMAIACAVVAGLLAGVPGVRAARHEPFAAQAGMGRAEAAARVWADDAALVYLENDEEVGATGAAARWGYLYYSAGRGKARGYSVRDGRIVVAGDLAMKFEAPPVAPGWIDSDAALAAADAHGGRDYCRAHAGRVSAMLLSRGTFQQGAPDLTTWTIVYSSPDAPSLFVVVDAAQGRVFRNWRG
jgi:hypothetical protein